MLNQHFLSRLLSPRSGSTQCQVGCVQLISVGKSGCVQHISVGKSGRHWLSDAEGNIADTDLQGRPLRITKPVVKMKATMSHPGRGSGLHRQREIQHQQNNVQKTIFEFIKKGDWPAPLSIHTSHINGNILVGMSKDREGKVTRYNKTGNERKGKQRTDTVQ